MSESLRDFDTWPAGIPQASVPANNNARRCEAFVGSAISATTTAQPVSPAERDIYIIPASATGAQWAGFDEDDVVIYYGATWTAFAPFDGLRKFVEDEGEDWQFVGSGGWAPAAGGGGSAAGADKQIQYNNAGAFGAEAGFEYDAATNTLTVSNITLAGLLLTAASATGGAGLRVPHGAAPTSPTNGDVWTTTAGVFARINGVTIGPLAASGTITWGSITGTLSSQTDLDTALSGKQPLDATLTALAGLATGANKLPYSTGTNTFSEADFTAAARTLLAQTTAVAMKLVLGVREPVIQSVASSATVTPTFLNDMVTITAQAAGLTLANPTGTPIPGLGIVIRIKDNGTARAIGYGTQYRAIGITLPTTTVIGKTTYIAMIFNSTDTKWDCVATGTEA